MNWLSRFTGTRGSRTTVQIRGKEIEVVCSARAARALAERDRPLIVEIELAFACFARKQVFFHEVSAHKNVIEVNGKLALLITTIIPDTCEATQGREIAKGALRNFMPKWVRIDWARGAWSGEYGL